MTEYQPDVDRATAIVGASETDTPIHKIAGHEAVVDAPDEPDQGDEESKP